MKLYGKLIFTAQIVAVTGLSIGGSKTDVEIGGIDNNVIKDAAGVPYIPGSSVKGKMRSLLEKSLGKTEVCKCSQRDCPVCNIFGTAASSNKNIQSLQDIVDKVERIKYASSNKNIESLPTRLYVRDAKLNAETRKLMEEKEGPFSELELTYTEGKWENKIERLTSKAKHPRQMERVPAGSRFDFNMVFNLLDPDDTEFLKPTIAAMRLLEDDYLGGNGSRGYGRIQFENLSIVLKTVADYEQGTEGKPIYTGSLADIQFENMKQVIKEVIPEVEG